MAGSNDGKQSVSPPPKKIGLQCKWRLRIRASEKEKIRKCVEGEFKSMVEQIREFCKEDEEDNDYPLPLMKTNPNKGKVAARIRLKSVGFDNYKAHDIKEFARKAIENKYLRDSVFSDKALMARWFYYLFIKLNGNNIKKFLIDDEGSVAAINKQLKGRKWKDAKISNHAGAWITEKLCEEYFPILELTEGALLKRIQVWEKTLIR